MLPEEAIMDHLNYLLTQASPGQALHHLLTAYAPAGAVGPLGLPEGSKVETAMNTLAPVGADLDVPAWITQQVCNVAIRHLLARETVLFAALANEVIGLDGDDDAQARHLRARGRPEEHPRAVELTAVYGACRDGRRWRGRRYVTGPRAGETEDVELLVGRVTLWPEESRMPMGPAVRALVGIVA